MIGEKQNDVKIQADEEKKEGKGNPMDDEQLEEVVGGMRVQECGEFNWGGANEISEGEGTPVDDEQLESVVGGMRALETEREGKKP